MDLRAKYMNHPFSNVLKRKFLHKLDEETKFLRHWARKPLMMGAVMPSSRALARRMASYIDPEQSGFVLELGPGTGAVTEALVKHGIPQQDLVLVEFNPEFCEMLRIKFPQATIIQGDAYNAGALIKNYKAGAFKACISSLPLFTKPEHIRLKLLEDVHANMFENAPFIQFTYALVPPIEIKDPNIIVQKSNKIWRNVPPARVWVYKRTKHSK